MQNFLSTIFTILLIYFLITIFFRLLFVAARFLLKRSFKKRFSGGFKEQRAYQDSGDVIDAEFEEIKK